MKIIGIGDLVLDVYMNEKEIIGITSGMSFANVIYNITRLLKEDKNIEFEFLQSNIEGEIVNFIQEAYNRKYDGIILNAGGYTHTSVAIHDAIKAVSIPTVEVHISNIHAREDFRKVCITTPACIGQITGLGKFGYILAVVYLIEYYKERK